MNREERLVFLLDGIRDEFLVQAFETDTADKFRQYGRAHKRQVIFRAALAAAACIFLFMLTPPGKVAAMNLYKGIQTWVQTMFSAQEMTVSLGKESNDMQEGLQTIIEHCAESVKITVWLEGFPEVVEHSMYRVLPGSKYETGFVLYVDTEHYVCAEENDIYTVRPQEFPDWLPPCYMEIYRLADITGLEAAEAASLQLAESYADVWDIQETEAPNGLYIFAYANGGIGWDAPVLEMWFIEDDAGGVYVIASHYFMEATEGHGIRFETIAGTFKVLH